MTPSAVMWVARAGIEPATFRFSGGAETEGDVLVLVKPGNGALNGRAGATVLTVWPHFGPITPA